MHQRVRTIGAVAAIGISAAALLTGCSGGSSSGGSGGTPSGTITLGYSGGGAVDTYMSTIIKHVEKELPKVTIKTVVYPTYDDQLNQLPTQFAAGTAPDIILWDNSAPIAEYATQGAIAPIDDQVKASKVDLSVFPKALVQGWTIDGKLYSVPSYLQNSGYAYNEKVLKQAGVDSTPQTLDQLAADARAVKAKTGKPGIVLLDNLFHLTQYALAFGGGWNYGKSIDSAQNVQAMDYLLGLFKDGSAATAKQLGATWDGEAFADDKAAMSDGGPWYIGFMSTTAPKTSYRLETIPGTTAGSPVVATYGGGFSVSAKSKDKDTDVAVIKELTDAYSQNAILTTKLGYVPASTKYAADYRKETPQYAAFTDQVLATGKGLDYPIKTVSFGNDLVSGFEKLVAAKATSSKALLTQLQQQYGQ